MIHQPMGSIHHIANLEGSLNSWVEVIDPAGRVVEVGTGRGPALDAQRVWHRWFWQCRVEGRAYTYRLVIADGSVG